MNIFDQYGIKEVADVTLYSIHKKKDGSGDVYYVPALYLDTLKISSVEKSAENVWAEGGHGNARLISWDYGKQINVTLEDALCTPASLGLCWGGTLSADWKDGEVRINSDICECQNPVTKISRMEKGFYPRHDRDKGSVSNLLPKLPWDTVDPRLNLLKISSVVDGTDVRGTGTVNNRNYKWKMAIESAVASIAVVPDRFFDVKGKHYPIDWNRKVSVNSLPTYTNYKDAVVYKINQTCNCVAPIPKIIFDEAMASGNYILEDTLTLTDRSYSEATLATLIRDVLEEQEGTSEPGAIPEDQRTLILENGIISKYTSAYSARKGYVSLIPLETVFKGKQNTGKATFNYEIKLSFISIGVHDVTIPLYDDDIVSGDLKTYLQNHVAFIGDNAESGGQSDLLDYDKYGSLYDLKRYIDIESGDYLAIIVDENNNYHALIGARKNQTVTSGNSLNERQGNFAREEVFWYLPSVAVDVNQFKGIDMWQRFGSINEMIYFLITKYENDIVSIDPATIDVIPETQADNNEYKGKVDTDKTNVRKNDDTASKNLEGKLWCYINPRTLTPYEDDYWFHQGEPFYKKSLTLAPKGKKLKSKRITVKADQWPGMYMMVGETYIRDRDTGEDERMQIKFPLCKVKSDQTLTLQADGDPTTFNLDLEVARPASGVMMEITSYEVAQRLLEGEDGCFYAVDGSTKVLSE